MSNDGAVLSREADDVRHWSALAIARYVWVCEDVEHHHWIQAAGRRTEADAYAVLALSALLEWVDT